MAISQGLREALFAPQTGKHLLLLVTIASADLAEPIRLCRDGWREDAPIFTSRGMDFVRAPFGLALPGGDDGPPRCVIEIANVDHRIREAIEAAAEPPSVMIELVTEEDPDTVEVSLEGLTFESISGDAMSIEGRLAGVDYTQEPWPWWRCTPDRTPALWFT